MKKRKTSSRARPRNRFHPLYTLLALTLGLSCHSCADFPSGRELAKAGTGLETIVKELGTAVREHASAPSATIASADSERTNEATESFAACRHFFATGKPPVVVSRPTHRALCYDAFAILHSGDSKTAVYVAEKLNRASVANADETRTNKFYADARLRSAERATLDDYKASGFDRGHLAPAGDMPTA